MFIKFKNIKRIRNCTDSAENHQNPADKTFHP
jgi:hypothetical protein